MICCCENRLPILLGALVGIFVITTIVLAVLFGVERNKKSPNNTGKDALRNADLWTARFVVLADSELCLTPYCVKAGELRRDEFTSTLYHYSCFQRIIYWKVSMKRLNPVRISSNSPVERGWRKIGYPMMVNEIILSSQAHSLLSLFVSSSRLSRYIWHSTYRIG